LIGGGENMTCRQSGREFGEKRILFLLGNEEPASNVQQFGIVIDYRG
jgi:hypothetical protein